LRPGFHRIDVPVRLTKDGLWVDKTHSEIVLFAAKLNYGNNRIIFSELDKLFSEFKQYSEVRTPWHLRLKLWVVRDVFTRKDRKDFTKSLLSRFDSFLNDEEVQFVFSASKWHSDGNLLNPSS